MSSSHPGTRQGRNGGRLELIIAVALGLAAITGAFAAYRNEQHNHAASEQFSLGVRSYDDAGQAYASGNATSARDQTLFLEYAKATQTGERKLASYIYANLMGATLQAAVRWWESPANTGSAHPARTPFTAENPDYRIAAIQAARSSIDASKKNFAEAKLQQGKADHFTLVEVILATALFLYGIAGVTPNRILKLGTLGTGLLIFVVSLGLLITG